MAQNKGTEIRLYPTFTEVREDLAVKSPYYLYLPQDLYNQIVPGSLNLEKLNVLSMNANLKENNLEGKVVFVHKRNELKEVTVVRGRDLLVQDKTTGRFFNVSRDEIEFIDIPEETGTQVTFVLEKDGDAVLSYLMYGIRWKPRYTLNVDRDNAEIQGWADIENTTQRAYTVNKTELFGGDVSLNSNRPHPRAYQAEMMMCRSVAMADGAPKIQAEGEKAGLYTYSISDGYVLSPHSTYSLPFVSPKLSLERVASYSNYFSDSRSKGKFSRIYRITSSEFLPNGPVTVREDGRVVGQSSVPDLSSNEPHDLNVGNDPDVSFERDVKTLFVTNDGAKYGVTIKISNNKDRDVKFVYEESFGSRHEITESKPNLTSENGRIRHESGLNAKGGTIISFVVQFYYNTN